MDIGEPELSLTMNARWCLEAAAFSPWVWRYKDSMRSPIRSGKFCGNISEMGGTRLLWDSYIFFEPLTNDISSLGLPFVALSEVGANEIEDIVGRGKVLPGNVFIAEFGPHEPPYSILHDLCELFGFFFRSLSAVL
jgi:hypothetical protein